MKKMLSILLAVMMVAALTVGLVGCGSEQAAPAGDEQEVLKVGLNAGYKPFEFKDENNKIVGFDMDVIEAMAEEMNMKVEYSDMDFGGLIIALNNGEFDTIVSAMTITDERKEKADFTEPYLTSGQAIAIMADNDEIKEVADLKGKMITGQTGTTGIQVMKERNDTDKLGATIRDYPNIAQSFLDLKSGVADAVVADLSLVKLYAKENSDIKVVDEMLSEEEFGMAVQKDDDELLKKMNAALNTIKENGTYDEIYKKWSMEDHAK